MRLSFVLSTLHLCGGVRVIVEYANRLTERGYSINLVAPKNTVDPDIEKEIHPEVAVYQSNVPLAYPHTMANNFLLAWSLSRAVPPSDIVFSTHTPTIPSAWLAARLWQKARLFWLHQDPIELFEERRLEQKLLQWGGDWHDRILTIGSQSQAQLKNFTKQEIFIVGEGLSHGELFYPRPRPTRGSTKTVLFLGDMRPRKGLQDFIAAAEVIYPQIPELELWVVSKDPCTIETSVPFRYIHRPNRRDLAELYAYCDLFVSASWLESFGLPPLEAMASGAPVVLTDSGGVREYAQHEANCLLVPPRCPEALAKAMQQTLTDPALTERFRQNGPTTAAKFTWQAAVDRFEAALKL